MISKTNKQAYIKSVVSYIKKTPSEQPSNLKIHSYKEFTCAIKLSIYIKVDKEKKGLSSDKDFECLTPIKEHL